MSRNASSEADRREASGSASGEGQPASSDADDVDEVEDEGAHLEEVPSGAGCTEIWEKLSEQREADRREASNE